MEFEIDCILFNYDSRCTSKLMKIYKGSGSLEQRPRSANIPTIPLPVAKGVGSTNVPFLKLGARALRKHLKSTNTLRTRSHRYPRDGQTRGTHADLGSVRRANGLTSC